MPLHRFCCSVAKSCPTLCAPMNCSTPGFPVLHCLLEFIQTPVHWVRMPSIHLILCQPHMASRWGNSENSGRLYFWGAPKSLQMVMQWFNCSHEIKRHLLLGRKVMTNLDSILKSRDITLPTKVHLVKAMVFPVVTYRCESWTIKKAECRRIDAFELWC